MLLSYLSSGDSGAVPHNPSWAVQTAAMTPTACFQALRLLTQKLRTWKPACWSTPLLQKAQTSTLSRALRHNRTLQLVVPSTGERETTWLTCMDKQVMTFCQQVRVEEVERLNVIKCELSLTTSTQQLAAAYTQQLDGTQVQFKSCLG
jgi:hypothetical protein